MASPKFTRAELEVLLQGINAIGWQALSKTHPERKAAESAKFKLETALSYEGANL